jgi:ATP-dependent DNA helicase PIF1
MTFTLSAEQQNVVDYLESTEDHVFVTGKAGAGKTVVLREFQRRTRKNIAVCAPTGIAALNAGGATIHNLIGLGTGLPADANLDIFKIRSSRKILSELDTIVIDEISMVSSDLLDAIDRTLQAVRRDHSPFGGLQVVMFGDVYQLPPVVSKDTKKFLQHEHYKSEWFFDAHVWEYAEFTTFSLEKIHRQADETFIRLLNGVRDGTISDDDLNLLNVLGRRPDKTDKAMLLGTRRDIVNEHNRKNLAKIRGKKDSYTARVNTGFGRMEPAEREIHLKPKARVMMLSNDRTDRWVNGSQGIIKSCGPDFIQVELDDETSHVVERFAWVKAGTHPDDYKDAPKFHQFPLKLAWGVTIHKSQGLSLREIDVDMGSGGAFSNGQTYVALSRVTTPEGLYISTPIQRSDIMVDPNVRRFFESL